MNYEEEYAKFMVKLGDKVRELHEDYENLSDTNKQRFAETTQAMLQTVGLNVTAEMIRNIFNRR